MARFPYAQEAPCVNLTLLSPITGASLAPIPAQLDSGAGRSVMRMKDIEALALEQVGEMTVRAFDDSESTLPLYRIDIRVQGIDRVVRLRVLAMLGDSSALLGLDALRHFTAMLDGPNQLLDIE